MRKILLIILLFILQYERINAQFKIFSTTDAEYLIFSNNLHEIKGTGFSYRRKNSWAIDVQLGGSYEFKNNLFMLGFKYVHLWLSKTQYMINEHPLDPHSPPGHPSYLPPISTKEVITQTDNIWEMFLRYGYSIKFGNTKMYSVSPFLGWSQNLYSLSHLDDLSNFYYIGSASIGVRLNIKSFIFDISYRYNIGYENFSSIRMGLGYVYTFKTKAERQKTKK